ncbi:MAG: zinc-binding dehydrogenase [Planctomycetaceae bacterium]|jgi:putative phosphonate catabolism associated alcohol dehydrogenase|nr:zinc-binding dehydrogenase [Planctomycetaceae bacterium]MBT6157699.1 zinc-binding dehydrogenase [Planctomycetaceae bacterium]MBT6486951.1 zinc-binding dehydrogenase [Planctomycetaceae bacterium]MBT6497308.1 zinc-binding dehydrogenase [Planctomycetaceae bacterium]
MSTSLAAIFHETGRELELRQLARPEPSGAEVVVRVLGCTLCGSDLHTFDGRRETPVPTILGHEIVGEISAMGDAAPSCDLAGNDLRIGDRVTWSIVASCDECFFCRRGLPQKCLAAVKYGHEKLQPRRELLGGLAEHCLLVPGTAIVRLPDEIPLSVACPASCATATIAAALAAAGDLQDRNVCLFGAGLLGLTACAMSHVAGAANVVCIDVNENRLTTAKEFGATHTVTPDELPDVSAAITEKHGFDVILELSGNPAAFECGWRELRRGGTLVLVGSVFPAPPVETSLEEIVRRNLTIHGIHNYTPHDLLRAVEFLTAHHDDYPFAILVSEWFPLEAAAEAFSRSQDPSRIRIGVRPG